MLCSGIKVEAVPMRGYSRIGIVSDEISNRRDMPYDKNSGLPFLTEQEDSERQRRIMELYDQYGSYLYKYLRTLKLEEEEAEDVVQETYLRLAVHIVEGGEDINLRSWIFQVGYNLAMDIHRTNKRDRAVPEEAQEKANGVADPGGDPERIYLQKEAMKRMDEAMGRLTPQQRSSILLRAQGLRYMEIGAVLGVSESRAVYLVKRGLKQLAGGL